MGSARQHSLARGRRHWGGVLLALCCLAGGGPLWAAEGRVNFHSLVSYAVDGQVYLSTDVSVQLSGLARSALDNGVALRFNTEIEVFQQQSFWLDKRLRRYGIAHRLSYQELTRRYRLERLETGERVSFERLADALRALASLRDLLLLPESAMRAGRHYLGRMSVALDLDALPSPLRTQAYFSAAWRLNDAEQQWVIR